ncbi:MAG TPA: NlpC/P60 family protein [Thermoleophilia bacterium]|nr:NlpC/P60 family protein [Thermoleophilia bacterium]
MIIRSRTARLCLLSSILLMLLLLTSMPAAASPVSHKKARLRAVQATLETLGMRVEVAVERYNQAAARLDTTRGQIERNRRLLAVAERDLERANGQLAARARSIYMAPEAGIVDVVFAARTFDELVTQFAVMQRLGDNDVDLVKSVTAYERDIKDRRLKLRADEKVAAGLVAQRASEKTAILANETRMRTVERGLRGEIASLLAQQAAAARAAAQRAAAQRAAAQPAVGSAGGGTGTGSPPPDPGGSGRSAVLAIAQRYLGIPYVWGGASPGGGFDCSGLTMYVFAQVGVSLAHGATLQQRASTPVPLSALQPGDLVFYGNASFSSHVAIYFGGGRTIEAARTGTLVRYGTLGNAWIGGRF